MKASVPIILLAAMTTQYSNANQTVQPPLLIFNELAERPLSPVVADLDENGIPELTIADNGGEYLTVLTVNSPTDIEVFQRIQTGAANGVGVHDVDGDDHKDLIIDVAGNLSVYKGTPSGNFETSPSSSLQLARASTVIRFGDVNNDGTIDIVSTNAFEDSVTVLINDGFGTFTEAAGSPFPTGQRSLDLEIADLDNDQNIDIVTVDEQSEDFTILLGDGAGSFSPGSSVVFNFSGAPSGINLEDWDLDGDVDAFILSCCSILPDGSLATAVSVLESDGTGNFEEVTNIPVGSNIGSLPTGDFDGDGDPDVALITADSTISILENQGSGQFSLGMASPPIGDRDPRLITVGDFSGDGNADVATINRTTDDLSIVTGDGMGGFSSVFPTALSFGVDPVGIALADINSDGTQDALVARGARGDIQLLRGIGNGLFRDDGFIPLTGDNPRMREPLGLKSANLNSDSIEDVVVATRLAGGSVTVFLGDPAGGFSAAPGSPFPVNLGPHDVAIGDVDGDDVPDIVVLGFSADAVAILLGNETGGFSLAGDGTPVPVGDGPVSIKLSDLDSDGINEIITTNQIDNTLSILKSNGSGEFVSALPSPLSPGIRPQDVDVGDLNADGNQDLAVVNGSGRDIAILLGDGEFQFEPASGSPITLPGFRGENIEIADFDDDGDLDIVATYGIPDGTIVLLNDGVGQFTLRGDTPFPFLPRDILVGELDGDSSPDVFMFFDADRETVQAITSDVVFTDGGEDRIIE